MSVSYCVQTDFISKSPVILLSIVLLYVNFPLNDQWEFFDFVVHTYKGQSCQPSVFFRIFPENLSPVRFTEINENCTEI